MPKCNACDKRATFNIASEKIAKFCKEHKSSDMIDVVNKKCEYENCNKHPVYNIIGSKIGKYCSKHKLDGMVDLIRKPCKNINCTISATFNFESMYPPIYCSEHKLNGMVNIKKTKCANDNCKIHPCFNYIGQELGKYCEKHKLKDMINIIHKKCIYENCNISPSYNYKNEVAIYCAKHKLLNMLYNKNKLCEFLNCNKQPNFNIEGQSYGKFCFEHKLSSMVNVISKRCKLCPILVKNKHEGYCLRCFIYTFPDKPVTRNYKTKEKTVTDYVLSTFSEYDWITDKKIQDGCSSRRPDMLLDLGYQVIIVEVDETQHKDYDCSCENKRIMELSKDVNHRPIVFIRFNPDEYNDADNNHVKSCWHINKLGICSIDKKKEKEWQDRLLALKLQIEYWSDPNNQIDKTVEIVQLYYDENNDESEVDVNMNIIKIEN